MAADLGKGLALANLQTALSSLLRILIDFGFAVAALLTEFEVWLRGQLQHLGVPHAAQTLVLLVVAALLILGSLRLFGGLIRFMVVLALILVAIHVIMPVTGG